MIYLDAAATTLEKPVAVSRAMAEAVGGCRARKLLIPMNSCGVCVAGVQELPLNAYVAQIVEQVRQMEN